MIDVDSLTPIQIAALSRVKLKDSDRKTLQPGTYNVDFVHKVTGQITVGKDSERKPTSKFLGKRVLALCLHYMGAQEKNVGPLLDKILNDATEGDETFLDSLEKDSRIVAALKRLDQRLSKAKPLPVKGRMQANLAFDSVEV